VSLVTGLRSGLRSALRSGLNPGSDPLASVVRDVEGGWYFPANQTQFATLRDVAGMPGSCSHIYLCQEPSGNLADSVGSAALTQSGAGHFYGVDVDQFERGAVMCTDGTAGQKWINSTVAPDPSLVSTAYLLALVFPVGAPAANRCMFANSGSLDCRLAITTGRVTIVNGASTTGTVSHADGAIHLCILQRNITASTFTFYSDLEKITGTFGAVASNPMFVLGGQTAAPPDLGCPYIALLKGADAEFTAAQAKNLITTITGVAPLWTP
jgi:hypothetical protein